MCVGGIWLVKCENLKAHCFPVMLSVPKHRVHPLVFYLQLVFGGLSAEKMIHHSGFKVPSCLLEPTNVHFLLFFCSEIEERASEWLLKSDYALRGAFNTVVWPKSLPVAL